MELKKTDSICAECGKTFQAVGFSMLITEPGSDERRDVGLQQKNCDDCCKVMEERYEKMTQGKPLEENEIRWADVCPKCYQDFDPNKLPDPAKRIFPDLMKWEYGQKGIGLIGDSKMGKTYLIFKLLEKWYQRKSICHTTGPELAWAIGSPDQSDRRTLINKLIRSDIAFIDDLGKEKITNTVEADLYHIAEQRRREMRPLFVTLNSKGDELAARMSQDSGMPIINRLRDDLCDFIAVK